MEKDKQEERIEDLAREVWRQMRNELLLKYRYFDKALFFLKPIPLDVKDLMTDGEKIYYSPKRSLKRFQRFTDEFFQDYLHILLHCIYYHPFPRENLKSEYWDLACDITIEAILFEMQRQEEYRGIQSFKQEPYLKEFKKRVGSLTAEKMYYFLQDNYPSGLPKDLEKIFKRDSHDLWYPEKAKDFYHEDKYENLDYDYSDSSQELFNQWKELSEQTKVKIESSGFTDEDSLQMVMANLEAIHQEQYDYGKFLEKFAVAGEDIRINEDEFDYIYYAYGLDLYGNIPLINPLEYKEVSKIREFVIAIDTSGSVKGELVQAFINKTYNILSQYENFYSKVNIHIVQCDSQIRRVDIIRDPKDFEKYIEDFKLVGFGGTDFRPVFDYVEEQMQNGAFFNLKGLIYFTDGHGTYPEKRTDYNTAFVFLEEFPTEFEPPIWTMNLVLKRYDLGEKL